MNNRNYPINFNQEEELASQCAKQMLKEKKFSELTEDEIDFIKKHYMGRQSFMAYYTDLNLARFMSKLLNATNGKLLDPCAGTGRLLEHLDKTSLEITCCEIDPQSAEICQFLFSNIKILKGNALSRINELKNQFDYFIANPPWGLKVKSNLEEYSLSSIDTEANSTALFLELCISSLKDGGRGVFGVPSSFYSNDFKLAQSYLERETDILAEIFFPANAFYSSNILVSGSILLLEKTNEKKHKKLQYKINEGDWSNSNAEHNKKLLEDILKNIQSKL